MGIGDLAGGAQASTAVAGCDEDDVDERGLAQLPGQGVLTAAVSDDEDAQLFLNHCDSSVSRTRPS